MRLRETVKFEAEGKPSLKSESERENQVWGAKVRDCERDNEVWVRMAIFAWPVDTRFGPTLMGRVLPGPIKNRVGFGFLKKKTRSRFGLGPGFYKNPT